MILPLFRRNRRKPTIDRLYGAIVAQARVPAFYAAFGVPDTVEGRLDMIMLHAVLLLNRLRHEDAAWRTVGQEVFDRFCVDMDDNLREMGIGDLSVPKVMQRIASAFYGRAKVYETALRDAGSDGLVAALQRNIYTLDTDGEHRAAAQATRLADYVRSAVTHLGTIETAALSAGQLTFPAPDAKP